MVFVVWYVCVCLGVMWCVVGGVVVVLVGGVV